MAAGSSREGLSSIRMYWDAFPAAVCGAPSESIVCDGWGASWGSRQAPFSITALLLAANGGLLLPCPPGDTRCLSWRHLLHKGKRGAGAAILLCWSPAVNSGPRRCSCDSNVDQFEAELSGMPLPSRCICANSSRGGWQELSKQPLSAQRSSSFLLGTSGHLP